MTCSVRDLEIVVKQEGWGWAVCVDVPSRRDAQDLRKFLLKRAWQVRVRGKTLCIVSLAYTQREEAETHIRRWDEARMADVVRRTGMVLAE